MGGEPDEQDAPFAEEPEPWRAPVACPRCYGNQTRFVGRNYEMALYECQVCGADFETEE